MRTQTALILARNLASGGFWRAVEALHISKACISTLVAPPRRPSTLSASNRHADFHFTKPSTSYQCFFASEASAEAKSGRQEGETVPPPGTSAPPPDDETPEEGEARLKEALLNGALRHVSIHGWTMKAIQCAAKDLQYSAMLAGVCTGHEVDLVRHFIKKCNTNLFKKIREESAPGGAFAEASLPDKIKLAVRWRLEMLSPYVSTWPQAMAILARPEHVASSLEPMTELIDGIWHAAGDTSSDVNWYTKRMVLQVVYTTTELYMLSDFSPGHADTWEALDRRMQDVASVGQGLTSMETSMMEMRNKFMTFGP